MGYKTKVQRIKRASGDQYYIAVPAAMAQALGFKPSEVVEWSIAARDTLIVRRLEAQSDEGVKKKMKKKN